MNTSIASDERWAADVATKNLTGRETSINGRAEETGGRRSRRTFGGLLEDLALALLLVILCPLVILALGTPVALFARLLVEIAKRM